MCIRDRELFDKYYDMLMVMAGSVVYVGELGSGNVAKLANQIVVAVNIAAVGEALAFAKKAGTDPELVYQALKADGYEKEDHSSLVKFYEKIGNVTVE